MKNQGKKAKFEKALRKKSTFIALASQAKNNKNSLDSENFQIGQCSVEQNIGMNSQNVREDIDIHIQFEDTILVHNLCQKIILKIKQTCKYSTI